MDTCRLESGATIARCVIKLIVIRHQSDTKRLELLFKYGQPLIRPPKLSALGGWFLFLAGRLLLRDPDLVTKVKSAILNRHVDARSGLHEVLDEYANLFAQI